MPRVKYIVPEEPPVCELGEDCYSPKELSELIGISISTLSEYRRKGIGPKYIAVSYRKRRYPKREVLKYIEEKTRASTSATENYDL